MNYISIVSHKTNIIANAPSYVTFALGHQFMMVMMMRRRRSMIQYEEGFVARLFPT